MRKTLHKGPRRSANLVELMLECHERIRHFARLATQIAAQTEAPPEQILQACSDVERYFVEALPLHVADEEESVLPRLQKHSPEVEQALATMQCQHITHMPKLQRLLSELELVRAAPHEIGWRASLAVMAGELEQEFSAHLALEEQVIFPALAQLETQVQDQILAELRARRSPPAQGAGA